MTDLKRVCAALCKRGFEAHIMNTAEDAAAFILSDMPAGQTVAIGGCMTARQMSLDARLRDAGHSVLWHWDVAHADRFATLRKAMHAPRYICSTNAVTEDGLMVNIDGTGNRVAAMCYGPDVVYILIGRNKIVEGGYQQAVRRIKQIACPLNARRLGLNTPCAQEGGACSVSECTSPMCSAVVSLERAPTGHRMVALLIDEELGY